GQFSGDDLEFESFMFDQGDTPQSAQDNAAAPQTPPAPISAPVPASNGAHAAPASPATPATPGAPPALPRISADTVSGPLQAPLRSDAPVAEVSAPAVQARP